MPSLNSSLPEPIREWIEAQVKSGRYGNVSEYIRDLVRRDQERIANDPLEQLLIAGLDSGRGRSMKAADGVALREEVARGELC